MGNAAAKPTPCSTSDDTPVRADCKCATSSSTNECGSGKFCWKDNTCKGDAKKPSAQAPSPSMLRPKDSTVEGNSTVQGNSAASNFPTSVFRVVLIPVWVLIVGVQHV